MTITVYAFEDGDGNELGSFTTQDYAEAKEYARANRLRVIGREFEYVDSELLDDFTITADDYTGPEPGDDGDDFPLYHRYPGQTNPQPAYLYVDCPTAKTWCDYNPEIGNAVGMDVWNGHVLRFRVDARLSGDQIDRLIGDAAPLTERIRAGYTSHYNGRNTVGRLDDDARLAADELGRVCEKLEPDYDAFAASGLEGDE